MRTSVHVLGGAQTDFATKWREASDAPLQDMLRAAAMTALEDAQLDASDVEVAHVGNFVAERFSGQAHLGSLLSTFDPAWDCLPAGRHEGACASGSLAVLAAMSDIEAGRYDVALVAGVELMRTVPGKLAAAYLDCAADVSSEVTDGVLPWPDLFSRIADEVDVRYGLDEAHLRRIAELNRENARRNPFAQSRDWPTDARALSDDAIGNPVVAGRLRASDCGLITDGASVVILASDRFADQWRRKRADRSVSSIAGWGHRSAPLSLAAKLRPNNSSDYLFPALRRAILDAYGRAQISGPQDLDMVELHDCFTITEYVALDHLGVTPPGRSGLAVESGQIDPGGPLPVNPSGGLIGAGHPVGATGVRMLLDVHKQVTGTAGAYQVPGARTGATLNIGGSFSTTVSFVLTGDERQAA